MQQANLTGSGGLAEIRTLLAQRAPIYEACSHLTVDAENRSPEEIAGQALYDAATS